MDCKDSPLPRGMVLAILKKLRPINIPTTSITFLQALYCLSVVQSIGIYHKDQGSQETVTDNYEKQMLLPGFFLRWLGGACDGPPSPS